MRGREREKNAGKREITITRETKERTIEREIETKKKKRIWGKRRNSRKEGDDREDVRA